MPLVSVSTTLRIGALTMAPPKVGAADLGCAMGEIMSNWEEWIPATKGMLPEGAPLRRTDPSGECRWKIAFLSVYPAATKLQQVIVGRERLNLPTDVEAESFAPGSASGKEFEDHYLAPLGLDRRSIMVTDMLPYYLANTTASGRGGRSMADNIRAFEAATGTLRMLLSLRWSRFSWARYFSQ